MKHNLFSRFIGVLLAVVMLASLMSMPSLANTVPETDSTVAGQTQTVDQDQTVTEDTEGEEVTVDDQNDSTPADGGTEVTEPTEGEEVTTPAADVEEETTPPEDSEEVKEPAEGNEEGTTPAGDDSTEGTAPSESGEEPAEPAEDSTEDNDPVANSGVVTGNDEETTEPADSSKNVDVAGLSGTELLDALLAMDDETLNATLAQLTQEQLESLQALDADALQSLSDRLVASGAVQENDGTPTETPEFTTVGPILQIASSASYAKPMMRSAARSLVQQKAAETVTSPATGLLIDKNVTETPNENGVYTIDLHAAAESKIVTTSSPCDIILVLDRSGSMEDDGKDTALINAAKGFVDTIKTNSPDSRVAVVAYAEDSKIYSGSGTAAGAFVPVSQTQDLYEDIQTALTRPNGGTYSNEGLNDAYDIYQAVSSTDTNYDNSRAVVLFTDGIPGTGSWGFTSYCCAQNSIHWSRALKADKGTTVEIDTSQKFYTGYGTDFNNSNKIKIGCGATIYTVGVFPDSKQYMDDTDDTYVLGFLVEGSSADKINEYMYRVSSHRPNGSHVETWPDGEQGDFNYPNKKTRNQENGYYLVSNDTSNLNDIFTQIAQQTGKPIEDATIRDYISPYFDLVDANGNPLSEENTVQAGTYTGVVKKDATRDVLYVEWTKVTLEPQSADGTVPAKEFDATLYVKPKDAFMGGDDVPTNVYGPSGVYDGSGKCIGSFDECKVDVAERGNFTVADQSIYLSQSADPNAMVKYSTTGPRPGVSLGGDAKSNDFVTIVYTIVKTDDNTTGTYTIQPGKNVGESAGDLDWSNLTNCTDYTVTCTVGGTEITPTEGDSDAVVHVYKPTVTWKDSKKDYGSAVNADALLNENKVSIVWSDAKSDGSDKPTGSEPILSYTFSYSPVLGAGNVLTQETVVTVTNTKINDKDYSGSVTHEWKADSSVCDCTSKPGLNSFRIHLNTGSLTITKKFYKTVDGQVVEAFATNDSTFLFKVTGQDPDNSKTYYVAVKVSNNSKSGSVVLENIPTGNYMITEIAWPNGYEGALEQPANVINNDTSVEFKDEVVQKDYIHDDGVVVNNFDYEGDAWHWKNSQTPQNNQAS